MSWGERAGVRRNWTARDRKALADEWTEELRAVLDDRFEMIGLPDTLEARYRFIERVQGGGDLSLGWDRDDKDALEKHLLDLAVKLLERPVLLLSSADRVIGAVRTAAGDVLTHWEAVWAITEEDLGLVTEDGEHGLCLEENWYSPADGAGREDRFDLIVWGDFAAK